MADPELGDIFNDSLCGEDHHNSVVYEVVDWQSGTLRAAFEHLDVFARSP